MKYNPSTTIKDLRKAKKLNQDDLSRIELVREIIVKKKMVKYLLINTK